MYICHVICIKLVYIITLIEIMFDEANFVVDIDSDCFSNDFDDIDMMSFESPEDFQDDYGDLELE